MNRRYQVFLSSTYKDLKAERQAVTLTLLQHKCIPVGMEIFPAADHDPWDTIKRVIEESDYYLLILGWKYGSCPKGSSRSFTEREYRHAVALGKPIVAFLRGRLDVDDLKLVEADPELAKKVMSFRRLAQRKLVKEWNEIGDLKGHVADTLYTLIETNPRPGWIPANECDVTASIEKKMSELEVELNAIKGRGDVSAGMIRYDNHEAAQREIRSHIVRSADSNEVTVLRVLGVSLKYSWPFIEKIAQDVFAKNGARFHVEVAYVAPDYLRERKLREWAKKSESTRKSIRAFAAKSTLVKSSAITISSVEYHNLPHWHGLLINDNALFLGRANWEFADNPREEPKLWVGQTTYRLFLPGDAIGGADRISLFNNWFRYYSEAGESKVFGNRPPE